MRPRPFQLKKFSVWKKMIKMGHDKRPKMTTYPVSDIGHVNPCYGTVLSATCTSWRQPLSLGCVLFRHMLFIFQTQSQTKLELFLLSRFIITSLWGALRVSQFKSFKSKIYHQGMEINFMLPKFQVCVGHTLPFLWLPKRLGFLWKTEATFLHHSAHSLCFHYSDTQ